MPAAITDLMDRVTDSTTGRPVIGALAAPGKAIAAPSVTLADATNWTTTTAIHFSIYKTMVVGGITVKDPSTQTDWKGTLAGTTISNLTLTGGTDRAYATGDIIEITPTSRYAKDLYDLLISFVNQDGSLKTAAVQTALYGGAVNLNGYSALGYTPSTVTNNGNRSYDMVYNAVDLTTVLSPGARLRLTRTVTAPTQCASLNGTTQYFSKAAPAGMTGTNNYTFAANIKPTSYATGIIVSRFSSAGTNNGWNFYMDSSGRLVVVAWNASNNRTWTTQQAVSLNKWSHVTARLDMTSTATSGVITIDGIDVPVAYSIVGAGPAAWVNAGNLEIGSNNGGSNFFPGKVAQVAIFGALISQATLRTYMSQGLAGTETNLISAYSFNNSIADLNTTNANNLTANGAAAATNADSFCTQDVNGTPSGTNDFAIVTKVSFSTNTTVTVQVPEGCTIPTSGGVSIVVYSNNKVPFGFPAQRSKWVLEVIFTVQYNAGVTLGAYVNVGFGQLSVPVGAWLLGYTCSPIAFNTTTTGVGISATLSTANNTGGDVDFRREAYSATTTSVGSGLSVVRPRELTATTIYFLNFAVVTGSGTLSAYTGDVAINSPMIVTAECAYL